MKRIILAFDPGTGSSVDGKIAGSALGVAIFDPNSGDVLSVFELRASIKAPAWKRIQDLAQQARVLMIAAVNKHGPLEVRTEVFVMRGQGGETLARLSGALISGIPVFCEFKEVHNIQLKRNVAGDAKADKEAMGEALKIKFKDRPASLDAVCKLIQNKSWDAIDALCVAVCPETLDRA